ncbi:MAG: substrate-binding domain-containing protein [Myxococcales bacterium]|nr:substrate-binding domain-containing protein [Myxococcales bacterium]
MRPVAGYLIAVLWCALTTLAPGAQADGDDIVVVVNKANPASELSRDQLRPIFQTTRTEWSDGTKAIPLNLPDDDAVRQRFDAAVLGLDPDRVQKYWIDRKVRGGERPPRRVPSAGVVLRVVASDHGAVGYVESAAADKSVKIVARIRGGQVVAP